ncbi:hypothetical protein [Mesorhizobium sp. M0663]|uniref:hypothetical protein n=1 Tax=unclassified Mesorhizobium TaxID=325217 RepID=UPI003337CB77
MSGSEHENFEAIWDFTSRWRDTEPFGETWPQTNQFAAQITYRCKGNTTVDGGKAWLETTAGQSDGAVHLNDCKRLSSAKFHLDFSVKFQTYMFDQASGALVISGSSDKMGGDYSVAIIPVVQ